MKPLTANAADDVEHMPHAAIPSRAAQHTGTPHLADGDRAGRAREAARGVWVKRWSLSVPDAGPRRTGTIDPDPLPAEVPHHDPRGDAEAPDPDAATAAGTAPRPAYSR